MHTHACCGCTAQCTCKAPEGSAAEDDRRTNTVCMANTTVVAAHSAERMAAARAPTQRPPAAGFMPPVVCRTAARARATLFRPFFTLHALLQPASANVTRCEGDGQLYAASFTHSFVNAATCMTRAHVQTRSFSTKYTQFTHALVCSSRHVLYTCSNVHAIHVCLNA